MLNQLEPENADETKESLTGVQDGRGKGEAYEWRRE